MTSSASVAFSLTRACARAWRSNLIELNILNSFFLLISSSVKHNDWHMECVFKRPFIYSQRICRMCWTLLLYNVMMSMCTTLWMCAWLCRATIYFPICMHRNFQCHPKTLDKNMRNQWRLFNCSSSLLAYNKLNFEIIIERRQRY